MSAEPNPLAVEGEVLGNPENGQRRAAVLGPAEVALNLPGCGKITSLITAVARSRLWHQPPFTSPLR